MKSLIISGGSIQEEFAREILENNKFDYVVAADKGLEFCDRHHLKVDYIVGDFDSIEKDVIDRYERDGSISIDRYNPVKDYTDNGIAMRKAVEMGATEVYFIGSTGTRMDHTLTNIFSLHYLHQRNIQGVIVDAHNRITMPCQKDFYIEKSQRFGKYISFYPYTAEVTGLTLEGFKYQVFDRNMGTGDEELYCSNEIAEEKAHVSYKDGIMIMVESRD